MPGRLILFPVPIGAEDVEASLPAYNLQLLNGCHTFIVEELRTARRFLKHVGYQQSIDETTFYILNEHTEPAEIGHYLDPIDKGEDVGLLSEAGLPCVADPGALVTRMAQSKCVEIVPLVPVITLSPCLRDIVQDADWFLSPKTSLSRLILTVMSCTLNFSV